MELSRRHLILTGSSLLLAAPAIVKATSLEFIPREGRALAFLTRYDGIWTKSAFDSLSKVREWYMAPTPPYAMIPVSQIRYLGILPGNELAWK